MEELERQKSVHAYWLYELEIDIKRDQGELCPNQEQMWL